MSHQDRDQEYRIEMVRQVLRSPGEPLGPAVRALMEARFGRDLSRVRLHADARAAASARALGARAYAAGPHVVFAEGAYDPGTRRGLWLLAHELAHVVQQGGGPPAGPRAVADPDDPLERAADRAADLVAAGRRLPPGFAFGAAPAGVIQLHDDVPCPGTVISAKPKEIYEPANTSIELAYKAAHPHHVVFLGSQFETGRDVLLPRGVRHEKFGNELLTGLRGLVHQRRPDIIDFDARVFYEIKGVGWATSGTVQLESYYVVADLVRLEYNRRQLNPRDEEPPWNRWAAVWYPPHVLPLASPTASPTRRKLIVCTQATNHSIYTGLILYDVRELGDDDEEKKDKKAVSVFVENGHDVAVTPVIRMISSELRRQFPWYDPANPEYVIIVPTEVWAEWHRQAVMKDFLQPPSTTTLAVIFGVVLLVGVGVVLAPALAGGAAAAELTAAEVVATTTATEVTAAELGKDAVVSIAEAAAKRKVTQQAAVRLAKEAAPYVKYAAGVVLVGGMVSNAEAATSGAEPLVKGIAAIRAVPVVDFVPFGHAQFAVSNQHLNQHLRKNFNMAEPARGKFNVGSEVVFDGVRHYVVAKFVAR
jgi:hypothetical protein